MDLLKDGSTPIQFAKDNPKKVGSKAWDRYEQYKDANSISQAMEKKAGWQDLTADFEKGFLKIMNVEVQGPNKRPAPEGTPDREAQARTKSQASNLIPRSLPTEIEDPISKVEISAATLTALRMVMREEITHGVSAMESRLMNRMDEQIQNMKEDIEKEKAARGLLESRLHQLETKQNKKIGVEQMGDEVDKSIAVIGGFGDKGIEEAEDVLKELLAHINGFQDVNLVESNSGVLGLAQFDTPSNAFKFVRSQKKHPRRRAGQYAGAALQDARKSKERTYPELLRSRRCRLVVLAIETGGRWSPEATTFLRLLAQTKARAVPNILRKAVEASLLSRWSAILTHAAQHAFAASLLDLDCAGTSTIDGDTPSISQLLSEAPHPPPPTSRLPARP